MMRRDRQEQDRIKERIRLIKMNKPFKSLGALPWNPLAGNFQRRQAIGEPIYEDIRAGHLPRGIFL